MNLKKEMIHIHDPGRLKELLYPGNRVLLKREGKESRKTKWDLIAARWDDQWILVHSGYHNSITGNLLNKPEISPFGELKDIRSEVIVGGSRMDFLLTKKDGTRVMVEVKGCTLTQNGIALFPDAPTERGRRHLDTLMKLKKQGMETAVIILILGADATCFRPNRDTDPKFTETFYEARGAGVEVYPLVLNYENGKIFFCGSIPVCPERH